VNFAIYGKCGCTGRHLFGHAPVCTCLSVPPWQGFYTVYGSLFEKLAKQEERAWEERRSSSAIDSDEEGGPPASSTTPSWPK
jgi:hypothetical protein